MKRAAIRKQTISGVIVSLALAVGAGGDLWLNPQLSGFTNDELRVEAKALIKQFSRQPWFVAWAPALRHEAVCQEMQRRGVVLLRK